MTDKPIKTAGELIRELTRVTPTEGVIVMVRKPGEGVAVGEIVSLDRWHEGCILRCVEPETCTDPETVPDDVILRLTPAEAERLRWLAIVGAAKRAGNDHPEEDIAGDRLLLAKIKRVTDSDADDEDRTPTPEPDADSYLAKCDSCERGVFNVWPVAAGMVCAECLHAEYVRLYDEPGEPGTHLIKDDDERDLCPTCDGTGTICPDCKGAGRIATGNDGPNITYMDCPACAEVGENGPGTQEKPQGAKEGPCFGCGGSGMIYPDGVAMECAACGGSGQMAVITDTDADADTDGGDGPGDPCAGGGVPIGRAVRPSDTEWLCPACESMNDGVHVHFCQTCGAHRPGVPDQYMAHCPTCKCVPEWRGGGYIPTHGPDCPNQHWLPPGVVRGTPRPEVTAPDELPRTASEFVEEVKSAVNAARPGMEPDGSDMAACDWFCSRCGYKNLQGSPLRCSGCGVPLSLMMLAADKDDK